MVEEVDRDHGQPLQEIWTLLVRAIAFALSPNACRHTQVDERAARRASARWMQNQSAGLETLNKMLVW